MNESALWLTRQLRLTAFVDSSAGETEVPSWQSLVGREPESMVKQAGLRQEFGEFDGVRLVVATHVPARIDAYLSALTPGAELLDLRSDHIGSPTDALERASRLVGRLSQSLPSTTRLALGLVLIQPAVDHDDAYSKTVKRVASVAFDLKGARDFSYQINRPRESTAVRGVQLNRLSRWSAIRGGAIAVNPALALVAKGPQQYAVQLELDMSTEAERTDPFEPSAISALWAELGSLAHEIAELGDVR